MPYRTMTSHACAKVSLISGIFALAVQHQAELSVLATIVAVIAGAVSIWNGLRGK